MKNASFESAFMKKLQFKNIIKKYVLLNRRQMSMFLKHTVLKTKLKKIKNQSQANNDYNNIISSLVVQIHWICT
jgi:hypothetical protein